MRTRLLLFGILVAILAAAGVRHADADRALPRSGGAATGRMAPEPAPEPDTSAIAGAPLTATASVQKHLAVEARRVFRPEQAAAVAATALPPTPADARTPLTFPLLI